MLKGRHNRRGKILDDFVHGTVFAVTFAPIIELDNQADNLPALTTPIVIVMIFTVFPPFLF